ASENDVPKNPEAV
ncbi:hypothetical protein M513_14404, partial [Trichuris suis]